MLSLLFMVAITTPLVKLLYNPSLRYVAQKRRTVQHSKPQAQLRLLACVHNDDNVAPIIDLLEATNPTRDSPISILLLHLTELAGRAASILKPHKSSHKSSSILSPSDHIVNAFRYFEQQNPAAVSLHPFIAMSPYATMHNDVCSLALQKKIRLIILPFHKQSDGARETSKHSFQSLNRNVLNFAPCSVAILVDRAGITCTHTNHLMQRVAVYFLGGPDDREALAFGSRMADSRTIGLTVVRFRARTEEAINKEVDRLDEEMIGEFRKRHAENEGVVYMEKVVVDAEGTVGVIRGMSEKFDLLIVGRRKGMESELTSGMSAWSECPELGILGDMLTGTDFGGKVSILVVQQQERVGAGGELSVFGAGRVMSPPSMQREEDVFVTRGR